MLFHDWWRTAYMALHSDFPPDPSYDSGPDKMTRLPTKVSEKPDAQGQDIHIQRAYVPRPSPSFGKRLDCCTGPVYARDGCDTLMQSGNFAGERRLIADA